MIVRRHALIGAALMALAAGPAFAAPAAEPGDMSLGNPNARVKVVEYASLSCPHCAHFNDDVFRPSRPSTSIRAASTTP
jgi:protein-disulfide isomerase